MSAEHGFQGWPPTTLPSAHSRTGWRCRDGSSSATATSPRRDKTSTCSSMAILLYCLVGHSKYPSKALEGPDCCDRSRFNRVLSDKAAKLSHYLITRVEDDRVGNGGLGFSNLERISPRQLFSTTCSLQHNALLHGSGRPIACSGSRATDAVRKAAETTLP